jgi:hypothetical protein
MALKVRSKAASRGLEKRSFSATAYILDRELNTEEWGCICRNGQGLRGSLSTRERELDRNIALPENCVPSDAEKCGASKADTGHFFGTHIRMAVIPVVVFMRANQSRRGDESQNEH